jgi:holo-[acyl-carrier protein] synthase
VEVINDSLGKPDVLLHGKARDLVGKGKVLVSVSHTTQQAIAMVVLQSQ